MYYWFSKIVYDDLRVVETPSLLDTDPETWWLSIMMRWMIPFEKKPAPHNILLGQWEPTDSEASSGISDGFGAVSALWFGDEQCGLARHKEANARTDFYLTAIESFAPADGSWEPLDTIMDWESSDCIGSAKAPFPADGDYANLYQFIVPRVPVTKFDGTSFWEESETCFIVSEPSDYNVWSKDAFRMCIFDKFMEQFYEAKCVLPEIWDKDNEACRPMTQADCPDNMFFDYDHCRYTVASDCLATETFDWDHCRTSVEADCTSGTNMFFAGEKNGEVSNKVWEVDRCRPMTQYDCEPTEIFDKELCTGGCCRGIYGPEECTGKTP